MLANIPNSDPSLLYRYRDNVCTTDAIVASIIELDLLNVIAKQPGTVAEISQRLEIAERPLDVIITLL
ncbi:MAG: hypothetical protein JW841_00320 [Deltaproteobacteria bacterium]|nr:hypothetical protein [Deltaproteobacteria bacterium]